MIYGNKFLILNEGGNADQLKAIYTEKKAQIDEQLKNSQQSFKAKEYKKAIGYCKKIVSICDQLIEAVEKIDPEGMSAKISKKKYIGYANYMKNDANLAIKSAEKELEK